MQDRIFGDREKAMESDYFRKEEAKLLEQLRQRASLDEIARSLKDKLQVDNPELLATLRDLGVTPDNATAFLLLPLVQVAWAEGKVRKDEHEAVMKLAHERGVEQDSAAEQHLREWLATRPADALFDASLEVLKSAFSVLPGRERHERIEQVIDACRIVAEASGTEIAHQLGLGTGVSRSEASLLEAIKEKLRARD
jgi:tellurite resistance protein